MDVRGAGDLLIRLGVGLAVFVPEGIQKLIHPDLLGAGRFARIGIPAPEVMGPLVGTVEILCGALIVLNIATRLAALPLVIVMIVALVSTKLPILLGQDLGIFHVQKFAHYGLWSMLHEARLDMVMLLSTLWLALRRRS